MPIYCMGFERTGHRFPEGRLTATPDGMLCAGCHARRLRHRKRAWVLNTVRERELFLIDSAHTEPVRTRTPEHGRLAASIARAADPDRAAVLLNAHDGALELVLADDGSASLWAADGLIHRIPAPQKESNQ